MANNTDWLSISALSGGSGTTVLTLSATSNEGTRLRNASITVMNLTYDLSKSITVRQTALSSITFVTDTSPIDRTGETRTITVENHNISANTLGLSGFTAGTYTVNGNVIYITYPANASSGQVTYEVVITARTPTNEVIDNSFTILQNGSPLNIPYTADTSAVASGGEIRTITIDTSGLVASSITIDIEGATGITYTYNDGILTVTFPENTGSSKDVNVIISADTLTGGNAESTIHYVQLGLDVLEPLTFSIISGGTIKWSLTFGSGRTIKYKKNGDANWTTITSSLGGASSSFNVSAGDIVKFVGNENTCSGSCFCGTTATFNVYGNVFSLLDENNFQTATTLSNGSEFLQLFYYCTGLTSAENLILPARTLSQGCYDSMFKQCSSLATAPALPATTLSDACYYSMFDSCTNLRAAPALPATTLSISCYKAMFWGCTSLTSVPELPATTLSNSCYESMFQGCTSLTTAPSFSATTLANYCCKDMFSGCTSLVTAPSLPAATLASSCYFRMFAGCTSLTTAPSLTAMTLAGNCYASMFSGCTSLTTAPSLPAMTLEDYSYWSMFTDCTNLRTAPALPATTLGVACYEGMFVGCTNLRAAPALPATALTERCYSSMFIGCSLLEESPELNAPILVTSCYYNMFINCTNLKYVTCLAEDISATQCTDYWLGGVANRGVFIMYPRTPWESGESGIPTNWTVRYAS